MVFFKCMFLALRAPPVEGHQRKICFLKFWGTVPLNCSVKNSSLTSLYSHIVHVSIRCERMTPFFTRAQTQREFRFSTPLFSVGSSC